MSGENWGDGTRSVHAGLPEAVPGQPFLPGPVFAAPYHLDPERGPSAAADGYGRPDNPTRRLLETAIGELEGADCRVFASGQAAITGLLLTVLRPGDTVLLPADGYYSVRSFASGTLEQLGVRVTLVPTAGPYPSFDGVRLVLLETPANPGLDADTMTAAVAAAHAAGVRAAVHTFSESAVEIMVRAGVDSVEHGTGLSLDLIDLMARQGTALVPTMINIRTFGHIAEQARPKFPGYADHMLALRDRFPEVVRAAHEAGVPIYVGTDAGGGIDHGLVAEEMLLLHEQAGMSAPDVLAAASWRAREWLGFPGLVEGGLADLVVYPEDPRRDLRVVRTPSRIVLRGRVVR
ncbi:hypothetical protein DLJ57_07215 [Micromonospora chalcea]|nr:hypothetical protein DLJ57_07215 [Micromonospora chalcea]